MTEEEKKIITREKHPGRVAQGHKLAALMKKRKEEILRSKEQSTVQSTVQPTVQSTVQSTIHPNDTYVYGVGILAAIAIVVCAFFTYQAKNNKQDNDCLEAQHEQKNKINHQNGIICFRSDDEKKSYIIKG